MQDRSAPAPCSKPAKSAAPASHDGGSHGSKWLARALAVLPGLLLAFAVGQVARSISRLLNMGAVGLAVAIAIGIGLVSSPLRPWLRGRRFEPGLRLVTSWLLKGAVVLSGLKVQVALFDGAWLGESLAILAVTLPTAFFVAHFMASRLRLRTEVGDLVGIGTMICGASAINALAPVVGAERSEQGLAITAVSTFSVVAMFVFLPGGMMLGLSERAFGMWSGLAVGDFSTAVGVGAQFSDTASIVATASKSLRVLLLGPMVVLFSWLRSTPESSAGSSTPGFASSMRRHLPPFIVGYLLCCCARSAGDSLLSGYEPWPVLLAFNNEVFLMLMLTVCASIGLGIDWRAVRAAGWRVVLAGGTAAATTAIVSLVMIVGFTRGEHGWVLAWGLVLLFTVAGPALRRRYFDSGARASQGSTR